MSSVNEGPHASRLPNNFDALRIAAAFTVLVYHQYDLMKLSAPTLSNISTWSGVAVWVFFVVSGYLVAQSWFRDPHMLRFAQRRVLRIWPALVVVVLLSVFVLGPVVTTGSLHDYWRQGETWSYFSILWMKMRHSLPGVFADAPLNSSVNGSLWTIPFEVRCYVAIAVIGALGLLASPLWLSGWLVLYLIWYMSKGGPDMTGVAVPGREVSLYFLLGAALFGLEKWWRERKLLVTVVAWGIAMVLWHYGWRYLGLYVAVPITVLTIGSSSWPVLRSAGRWGDPSYGLYLYAYPIQQTVIHYTYPHWSLWSSLAVVIPLTSIAAWASWHWIEKPALRFKPQRLR